MSEVISLADFRTRISIMELAAANGYIPNKKHWCNKYPVFDNPNTGERIYIVNPANSSNQGYVNVNDDRDKGTLIDFVRKRLSTDFKKFNQPGKSEFSNVNAVLYNHLSQPEPERRSIFNSNYINNSDKTGESDSIFNLDLLNIKSFTDTNFLKSRGIHSGTINHPNFAGTIFNIENKGFINTAFPYYDHIGTTVGIEIRNDNFKQHAENSKKSEGIWHSNPPDKINHIFLSESAIDALSYHQLHHPKNTLYISVGGNLSIKQVDAILSYTSGLKDGKDAKLLLGFDQDKEGAKYDLRFLLEYNKHQLVGATVSTTKSSLNLEIPLPSKELGDTAANIVKELEDFNKGYEKPIKTEVFDIPFSTSIQNNLFKIQIPNTYQAISFFNKQLITGLGIEDKIKLEKALSKDFNDDLKLKNVGQRQPERVKYSRKM
jgi:hypothetical protein